MFHINLSWSLILALVQIQISIAPQVVKWYTETAIRRCTVGSWAPSAPMNHQLLWEKIQCDLACDNGCNHGYALLEKDSNKLICYMAKFRANFRISLPSKTCSCGSYINEVFYDCREVNPKYAPPKIEMDPQRMQDTCQSYCNKIDSYISKKDGITTLVFCTDRDLSYKYDDNTRMPTGECFSKQSSNDPTQRLVYCDCGVVRPFEAAPLSSDDEIWYFIGQRRREGKSLTWTYVDINHNKNLLKDLRRHNFDLPLLEPSFNYTLASKLLPLLDRTRSKKEQVLPAQPARPLADVQLSNATPPKIMPTGSQEVTSRQRGASVMTSINKSRSTRRSTSPGSRGHQRPPGAKGHHSTGDRGRYSSGAKVHAAKFDVRPTTQAKVYPVNPKAHSSNEAKGQSASGGQGHLQHTSRGRGSPQQLAGRGNPAFVGKENMPSSRGNENGPSSRAKENVPRGKENVPSSRGKENLPFSRGKERNRKWYHF